MDKSQLRRKMRAIRTAIPLSQRAQAAQYIAESLPAHLPPDARVIGATIPLPDELDITPVLESLQQQGYALALPGFTSQTPSAGMQFYRWQIGAPLVTSAYGFAQPADLSAPIQPDIVLVPLLAFDAAGHRLGQGSGHYDRYLAAHPEIRTIGLAYECQYWPQIPVQPHDRPLDLVITEESVHDPHRK